MCKFCKYCETSLDECFKRVHEKRVHEKSLLTWFPWVGDNYLSAEKRILFVGESHYAKKGSDIDKEQCEKTIADINFTRNAVCESHVNNGWSDGRMIAGLHRALFEKDLVGKDLCGRISLWRTVAFYNFVQNLMGIQSARPSQNDFRDGWKTFLEVVKILKPHTVIFIGVEAMKHFERVMNEMHVEHTGISCEKIQERVCPRFCQLTIDNQKMRLLAIHHTSHHFSWLPWNQFLLSRLPKELEYLRNIAGIEEASNT